MILAFLLGGAAMIQAAPPSPSSGDDIVVIGQRLKSLRIVTKRDHRTRTTRCFTKPSSGDPVVDAGVCNAYLACVPTIDTAAAMEACMRPALTAIVKDWQERGTGRQRQPQ